MTAKTTNRIITVSASAIVQDYHHREIAPDETHQLNESKLHLWRWNNGYVAELVVGRVSITSPVAYENTLTPQAISDDLRIRAGGDAAIATADLS